jgi:hypothetical protein
MSGQRTQSAAFIAANTFALWGAIAIASIALWPIYEDPSLILLVVVAAVTGSAIAVLGAVFRWSFAVLLLVTVATFFVIGVPLAVPSESVGGFLPSLEGLRQLAVGVPLGWKQLLTITLPVGTYQALLVPALILVLGTSVVSLSIALRARWGDVAAVGPVVLFILATALGPAEEAWPVPVTLALVVLSLTWLMARRLHARREAIRKLSSSDSNDHPVLSVPGRDRLVGVRTVLSAVLIFVVAGTAGVAAVSALPPSGDKVVLRSSIEQPFDPRDYVSPLAGFRRYLADASSNGVLLSISGLEEGDRIRVATLDTYDGIVYSVGTEAESSASGSFTRVPFRFDQSGVEGRQVQIDVAVDGWDSVWLPTIGNLSEVDFSGPRAAQLRESFYYNDTTGTAAVIEGVSSGDSYELNSVVVEQPSAAALAKVTPGAEILPTPTVPEELERVLTRYTSGSTQPGERLQRMLDGLAAEGYISHGISDTEPPSRSGHSADRITQLLSDQLMIGDGEQYAVTAAIMARQLGFPSRVVFGFAPAVSAGEQTLVRGDSVAAWVEVSTEEYGWVQLDATPQLRPIPEEEPELPTVVSRPQPVVPPPLEETNNRVDITQLENTGEEPDELEPWLALVLSIVTALAWVLAIAGIILSPFLAIVAVKMRRRRARRRADSALDQIRGGWQEYHDSIVDHGLSVPEHSTRREIAALVGGARSTVLAAVADRAVFAPHDVSHDDAVKVWRAVDELRNGLDVGLSRWERLSARISTRSLGRGGPREPTKREEKSRDM